MNRRWAESEELRGTRLRERRRLGVFRFLGAVPILRIRKATLYFDANGPPSSKTAVAASELIASGIPEDRISSPAWPSKWQRAKRALRLVCHLPRAIGLLISLRGRVRRLADSDFAIIVGYAAFKRFMHRNPGVWPVLISDLTPRRILLAAASQSCGGRAIWWQDDYHYTETIPFAVRAAAVLNEGGITAVRNRSEAAWIFKREAKPIQPAPRLPVTPTAGVAVNGLFCGSQAEVARLEEIAESLAVKRLIVRLHPTSSLSRLESADVRIHMAPANQKLEEFLENVDFVIVGNSAVQLKILAAGKPVMHVRGLDGLEFDTYGYVTKGIIFGCQEPAGRTLKELEEFYRQGHYLQGLTECMSIDANCNLLPLGELAAKCESESQQIQT